MKQFTVDVYEVLKNPDLKSRPVMYNGNVVPQDVVPKRLRSFSLKARNHDHARAEARDWFRRAKRVVRSLSFSSIDQNTLIAYVLKE